MNGHRPLLGIGLIALAAAAFATMDSTTRYTGRLVPVLLMLWTRYGIQALVMGAWLAPRGRAAFRVAHPGFQLARGTLLLLCSAMSFYGVQHMPVAEFTAIVMLTPVLVTLLAGWLLHERVSRLRWALVGGCFVGALIVIRPGSALFGWPALFPLAGAFFYALFQVLTSKLAGLEPPLTTHFYTGAVGWLLLWPVLWVSPLELQGLAAIDGRAWALLAVIGLLGTGGHLLLLLALGMAPTATLMPFIYLQIGVAALVGWWLFGDLPDAFGWLGMAVIAACGAASVWLNYRERTERTAVALNADPVVD